MATFVVGQDCQASTASNQQQLLKRTPHHTSWQQHMPAKLPVSSSQSTTTTSYIHTCKAAHTHHEPLSPPPISHTSSTTSNHIFTPQAPHIFTDIFTGIFTDIFTQAPHIFRQSTPHACLPARQTDSQLPPSFHTAGTAGQSAAQPVRRELFEIPQQMPMIVDTTMLTLLPCCHGLFQHTMNQPQPATTPQPPTTRWLMQHKMSCTTK
jgi:hypothetical protein